MSKPGNERQWPMAISFLFLTLVSFAYSQTSRKMIAKTILKIEIRVKFVKIRGYLLKISVGNASTKAIT
jgi:hypothetical protein